MASQDKESRRELDKVEKSMRKHVKPESKGSVWARRFMPPAGAALGAAAGAGLHRQIFKTAPQQIKNLPRKTRMIAAATAGAIPGMIAGDVAAIAHGARPAAP